MSLCPAKWPLMKKSTLPGKVDFWSANGKNQKFEAWHSQTSNLVICKNIYLFHRRQKTRIEKLVWMSKCRFFFWRLNEKLYLKYMKLPLSPPSPHHPGSPPKPSSILNQAGPAQDPVRPRANSQYNRQFDRQSNTKNMVLKRLQTKLNMGPRGPRGLGPGA